MIAETNIDLKIEFNCPHCEARQYTSEHGFSTSINTGNNEIKCTSCQKKLDLVINESY
jgi:transcription elongation factor Elf1